MADRQSSRTASAKSIPRLARLARRLASSHSNIYVHTESLDVKLLHELRVLLDVFEPLLRLLSHQAFDEVSGLAGFVVGDGDADQAAGFGVHRGVLQVLGVHFAQALEPADVDLAALGLAAEALGQQRVLFRLVEAVD